jgi:hypothetical protein
MTSRIRAHAAFFVPWHGVKIALQIVQVGQGTAGQGVHQILATQRLLFPIRLVVIILAHDSTTLELNKLGYFVSIC